MKSHVLISVIAAAMISAPAFAAKPTKFVDGGEKTLSDGSVVDASLVTCSNKREVALLNKDGQWCIDEEGSYCHKKRMSAAKKACK